MSPTNNLHDGVMAARMAGEDRRMQILRIALSLFSQQGFRGTTTKEIAKGANISEAMVFRHFANKEVLYSAILDYKACSSDDVEPCELVAAAVERKDDQAVFEQLALEILQHHEDDPEFYRLLLHAALENHRLAEMFWERNIRPFYEFLGSYIRRRQREGAMIGIDPAIVVRSFLGMVIHHSLNNNLWDRKRTLLNISNKKAARHFANILIRGVLKPDATKAQITNGYHLTNGNSRKKAKR